MMTMMIEVTAGVELRMMPAGCRLHHHASLRRLHVRADKQGDNDQQLDRQSQCSRLRKPRIAHM